jgi:hypothetical protein
MLHMGTSNVTLPMRFLALALLTLILRTSVAQDVVVGINPNNLAIFKSGWYATAGYSHAVINNRKLIRADYRPGLVGGIAYYASPWVRITGDFIYHFPHNGNYALDDVHAYNIDLNTNLVMRAGESNTYFRAIFGASYLNWRGTYVGPNLNDNSKYYFGMELRQQWIAANIGCGFTQAVKGPFVVYGDFKLRFTSENGDLLSISDTSFQLGLQYMLSSLVSEEKQKARAKRKTNSGMPGRTYKWLKKR